MTYLSFGQFRKGIMWPIALIEKSQYEVTGLGPTYTTDWPLRQPNSTYLNSKFKFERQQPGHKTAHEPRVHQVVCNLPIKNKIKTALNLNSIKHQKEKELTILT